MSAEERAVPEGWTIEGAERLLRSLAGVVSVRVVAKPGGAVEEIHMLTNEEVSAKQTVRNVESALLARFDLQVDHRKISVAQSRGRQPAAVEDMPQAVSVLDATPSLVAMQPSGETRIVFCGHQVQTERSHQVKMVVTVEWDGERYDGEAIGPDVPRNRLEAVASATLSAIEAALASEEPKELPALVLDGVKSVEAFDRKYVLVSVHAITGRDRTALAGAAAVDDSPDRAVIMATLQATDRWVRGRI